MITARSENNTLIGAAFIGKQNTITWPDGNKAELFILGVDISYRRYKVGSALLKRSEEEAVLLGARKLILNTHIQSPQAIKFYKSNNYVELGILKDYYDNGDGLFMAKDLS